MAIELTDLAGTLPRLSGSFRDPDGFMFSHEGILYRQVNGRYGPEYSRLMDSGLYSALVAAGHLLPHDEVDAELAPDKAEVHRVLRPERLPLISYPYEWGFSQLRAAALLTLQVQELALDFGMSLKDASAYNIQFRAGRPIFIDTLSFETYQEGKPWAAYRQFCQHFLAPLALMAKVDIRLQALLRTYIDGVPLDLASRLLPLRSWTHFGLLTHIHVHARAQGKYSNLAAEKQLAIRQERGMKLVAQHGLIDSLKTEINRLAWAPAGTEWSNYYQISNYTSEALSSKQRLVETYLDKISPRPGMVWDLGANTGVFSRIAAQKGILTVSWDIDPAAVEINYQAVSADGDTCVLPLLLDLTNPSPGLGWAHKERMSLVERGPVDLVMALALTHHLAITNNVPLSGIADFLHSICRHLIIEFVPKSDSQVQKLLLGRDGVFDKYAVGDFEEAFSRRFQIVGKDPIPETERLIYLMEAR